jgi:hypothetical protein
MTIQVGLVGNGGIILASDLRVSADIRIMEEHEGNVAYIGDLHRKIEFDQRVAISCADDLKFARMVAKRIIAGLTDADLIDEGSASSAIERIIDDASSSEKKKAQWLVAIRCPEWHLFKCRLSPIDPERIDGEWDRSCALSFGWAVAGQVTNPAIFLSKFHDEFLVSEQQILLAAHITMSANCFNSQGIEGLEIVQCDANGVRRLSRASIAELKKKSSILDKNIDDYLKKNDGGYSYDETRETPQ